MKALQYHKSIPRYVLQKAVKSRCGLTTLARLAPFALREIKPPRLPNQRWVRIAPRLTGICGSDLATICASGSPYLAPVTSPPFVMGHELVGNIVEVGSEVADLGIGDRVVLYPALGCEARGITPVCDACNVGRDALCRNVTRGDVSAGLQTGFCRDTGGGFGQDLVAHRSQVYKIPDEIDDRAAVLLEPFACALHGALRATLDQGQTALVIGSGTIGLLLIAALRATGCRARIVAVARFDHQKRHALDLGADELLDSHGALAKRYRQWAGALGAEVLDPELGKPAVLGGADVTFDCVASSGTIADGIRFTKSGGKYVLIGMPGVPRGVDFTPLWFKELTIHAAYAYGVEQLPGGPRPTFDLAIELMRELGPKLIPLVGPPHRLEDYRGALASALETQRSGVVKTVFAPNSG